MTKDFAARVEELGALYSELMALVKDGQWRPAAEIAGALELDLDELRVQLREHHRAQMKAARDAHRADIVERLRRGLPGRLRQWKEQRDARTRADA